MKTKLNNAKRHVLKDHALCTIQPTKEIAARDKAYDKMLIEVNKTLAKSFPESELKVLRKYDLLREVKGVGFYVTHSAANTDMEFFQLTGEDSITLPIGDCYGLQPLCTTPSTSALAKAFINHRKAVSAISEAIRAIRVDFFTLIENAKTFEDVVEVWSGAEGVRSQIVRGHMALTTLNADTIKRIKLHDKASKAARA